MNHLIDTIEQFIAHWGYWAVALGLLMENTGIPVPGETILILASVVSIGHEHELRLPWIIVVGTCAATLGDNIGYWIGRKGGRALLERWKHIFRISRSHLSAAEILIDKHGAVAIFLARFIAGGRVVAGPLAGVLHMEWRGFAFFNFLGALVWVSTISLLAHFFGSQLDRLLHLVEEADYIILVGVAIFVFLVWWKHHRAKQSASDD